MEKLVNDPNGLIDKLKNRFFVLLPSPLRSEIINSCTNCKLSRHTDTEIRSYIRINKSIVIDFVSPEIVFYFVNSFLDWHLLANSLFPEIRLIEYLHGSVNYKPFVRNVSIRTRLTDEFPFACKKRKEEEKRRKNFDVRFLKKGSLRKNKNSPRRASLGKWTGLNRVEFELTSTTLPV